MQTCAASLGLVCVEHCNGRRLTMACLCSGLCTLIRHTIALHFSRLSCKPPNTFGDNLADSRSTMHHCGATSNVRAAAGPLTAAIWHAVKHWHGMPTQCPPNMTYCYCYCYMVQDLPEHTHRHCRTGPTLGAHSLPKPGILPLPL
jgi:hypothetical protein